MTADTHSAEIHSDEIPDAAPSLPLDLDDIWELAGRTPLQALASAYAVRLAAIRARADSMELADIGEQIAVLERICLRDGGRRPFGGAER